MPVHNEDIARAFDELADLLEIEGANPFRVRAYRTAARTVRGLGHNLSELVSAGEDLSKLPGIGKALAAKIREMLATGKVRALEKLHEEVPASIEELLKIPGLGPKRVKEVFEKLEVRDREGLLKAVQDGRLRALPGFGPKTERSILDALRAKREKKPRVLHTTAAEYGEPLAQWLREAPGAQRVVIAGSYRRGKETVGDLDILVTTSRAEEAMERFVSYDEITEVISRGHTRSSVLLGSGLQVDLRVVEPESFGAALHYFTGSKAHNIAVRRLGQQQGIKINEYGVYRGERRIGGETEESVFEAVGLPFIPPELREGGDEIEAAQAGRVPTLVELGDLQGDLHAHTNASDGDAGLQAMALAAKAWGLKYLAITDHSRQLAMAHGLDSTRLLHQIDEIDRLNDRLTGITLLKGIEVDILEDGSLDLADAVLSRLDLVIGSVHTYFRLPAQKQTERILRAMDHRYFTILGHPSGRLLGERPAYPVDMERLVRHAAERGCYLELNAQPQRLDLTDQYCRMARDEGVLVSIDSDSHREQGFANLRWGVQQARRGWLEKDQVLNTRSLRALRKLLRATMS